MATYWLNVDPDQNRIHSDNCAYTKKFSGLSKTEGGWMKFNTLSEAKNASPSAKLCKICLR